MTLQSNGLTDIGMGTGLTTNFRVQYETGLFDPACCSSKRRQDESHPECERFACGD